jgi:hypothetical protein
MKTRFIFIIALACLIFNATPAFAAAETSSTSSGNSDENNFGKRPDGFVLAGGLNWGLGSAASTGGATQARTVNSVEATALPGWQIGNWAPRLVLNYDFTGQNTDPGTVGNTNLRGTGYLVGLGTTYHWTRWDFQGGLELFGTYTHGEKSSDGRTSSFSKPLGFRLGGSYYFKDHWSADALFHYVQYSSNSLGDTTSDISSDKVRFWVLALGVSYEL